MLLTVDNYYSNESDSFFASFSQLRSFFDPVYGCETRALAELKGEYQKPMTEAILLGAYVDCLLTEPDKQEEFKANHPEMFSSRGETKGMLKSTFQRGIQMVAKAKKSPKFMKYLEGDTQTIMTGVLFGVPFKIKMDSYNGKRITDLKTVDSIRKAVWHPVYGKTDFITANDYILQLAIYQEIVFQNTGNRVPCYINAISKEPITDIEIIQIPNDLMHERIYGSEFSEGIANQLANLQLLKSGDAQPIPCGHCDYCLERKVVEKPISLMELRGII